MRRRASKNSEHALFTTERLCDLWERIRSDTDARRALKRLDEAGFRISHLKPMDATFKQPSWADYIAALPLLPSKPSARRIHDKTIRRKYWPLVRELHELAAIVNLPFVVGRKGGKAWHRKLTPERRKEIATNAAKARWSAGGPKAPAS